MLPFEGSKKSSSISRKLFRNNDIEPQGQTSSIDLSSVPSEIDALRSKFKEKGTLTAEDIKQSKDRINALRNIFPFYNPAKHKLATKTDDSSEKADRNPPESKPGFSKEKLCSDQYEEKDTCDKSDTESIQSIQECKLNSIVHSRIASYEGGELNSNNGTRRNQFSTESEINRTSKAKTLDDSWRYSKPKKGKLGALKEKYSNSVTNFTYDGFSFGSREKDNELAKEEVENLCKKTSKKIDYVNKEIGSEYLTDPSPLCEVGSQDNLIYRLQTEIDNLEARNKSEKLSNVIIGNKDILKLLSNKHLANLNIRVEKNGDVRKDNRWRDNMGSFRAAKSGIRTSLRSSKRKKKQPPKFRSGINYNNFEEKGTSDSTLKENESDSDEEFYKRSYEPTCQVIEGNDKQSKYSTGEYIKKKFPEYAKVNKKRGLISQKEIDAPPRSLSTSPIERAPVVKKICSSSARLKKDCEPTLTANPVKKVDSFRGSRVTRRNSFLYNTRGKTAKEGLDQESFVKTQAVRLRRKDSRNSKQSEYRVSVTIRPSTVANLANKFNTIILQNQPGNAAFGKVSVVESKVPKYYSSPRASFKRKYRHKSSKAAKESKAKESSKLKNENTADSSGIDNSIYYTGTENVSAATRRSLNNSLSELNMKDLFEDSDYNKTDEEKVCEKLKTALSSGKFKGETDDSEDDLSSKVVIEGDEISDAVGSPVVTQNVEDELLDSNILLMQAFTKSNKSDSEILISHNNDSPSKIFSSEFAKTNIEKPKLTSAREGHCKSDSIDSGIAADEDKLIRENREEQEVSLEQYLKSSDTLKDDDSATLGNIVPSAAPESQLNEECLEVTNTFENSLVLELGEARETNEDNLTEAVNTTIVCEVDSIQATNEECSLSKESHDAPENEESDLKKENNILIVETEMKRVPDEISSECSGSIRGDGNYSEVSSICSELKGKKSKDEMGIYTSLKTVVKNTVKKSKEKDAVKNREKDKKRSPSRERNKWYKRGKSRERKVETDDEGGEEKIYGAVTQVKKEKEGKLYEKWAFKRKPKEPKEKSSEGKTSEECSERKPREKTRDGKSKDKTKEKKNREKSKEKRNKENSKVNSNEKKKEENSSQTCQEEKSVEKEQEKSAEKGQERSAEKEQDKSAEKEQEICAEKEQERSTEKEQFKSIESRPNGEDRDYEDSKLSTASKGGEDIKNYSETTDSDIYQDFSSSDKEEAKEGLYGKLKFASRSRSREKRLAKKMSRVELRKLSTKTETIEEEKESPKGEEDTSLSLEEAESDSLTKKDEETKNEPLVIYEPHSSQGVKVIPPPPKTPVPSPPSSFLRLFTKNRNKSPIQKELDPLKAEETTVSSDSNDTTENIYENLYSPDMTKLKRNREKLEGRGIKPNSSFLWSGTAVVSTPATVTKAILDQVPKSSRFGKFGSSLISKNSSEDSSSDGHNYTEIQNNSSGDSQIVAYDDIGAASAVSYDEIAAPSSCGYDDIRPPSLPEVEFDHYKTPSEGYDPVNPPKSDSSQYDECSGGIITAQMAVIRQNKIDSLSYVYDDVSMYNSSIASHSYEPVCPPEQTSIPVIMEVPEGGEKSHIIENASVVEEEEQIDYDDSEYGPHEVFSYKLTQISKGCPVTATRTSIPSNPPEQIYGAATPLQSKQKTLFKMESGEESSNHEKVANSLSKAKKKRLEATGKEVNHWEDVTDSEDEEEIPVTLTTRIPFVRKPNLKRVARYRVNKKSWIQGVRDVAAHKRIPHVHAHSTNLAKVHPHHARTHITHTRSHTHIRTNTDHVITYSWRQKRGESDNEELSAEHYEAIYEVISPADEEKAADDVPEEELGFGEDLNGPLDDDSFDSDDSDEAYSRLQPQYFDEKDVSTLRERVESFSSDVSGDKSDTYFRQKYGRSISHQPHSINKLAEAANLGMKRLRRNWSVTKNEVRTGLSKIKKKSTFSGVEAKSTEDILSEMSSSQSEKAKWSFRHFRRKSTSSILPSSLSLSNEEKDKATFYLTLTIASDRQEAEDGLLNTSPKSSDRRLCSNLERRKSNTPSISSVATTTSCDTSVSSRSRPLSMPGTSLFRNTSSGSTSGALLRPTTAPPAPPVDAEDEEYQREISKEQLACRLNQILSAGPPPPPGRRILKYSECSSSESSPVPLLLPCEDKSPPLNVAPHSKYSSPPQFPQLPLPRRGNSSLSLSSEITNSIKSNVPQARLSIASSSSSHGYIRACDIASSPPPLPARPTSIAGSGNSLSLARLSNLSQSHPNISAPIMISGTSDIDNRSYLDLTCDPNVEDEPPYMSSHFADEPLYQFYTAKVERAALYQGDSSEDDYEVINDGGLSARVEPLSRPTAMELVTPTDGRRTLWCELPEVINSGILSKISSQERKVQEAIFEVVTSEASYLKSLEVLVHHFMNCEEISRTDDPVITSRDRNVLFSDIIQVKKCSELFLADLEKRWQESFMISRITDIIHQHSTSSFNCYIKYCSNQIYQDRKLRHLKVNNPRFVEVLNRLESAPICQSLAMHSFLMLPMQRITRLPLLVDAIFNRLEYGSSQWQECKTALASLQKIVSECNEGARKMERMEEMLIISHQLDFREVKAIPLISASRWLVKKGELTRLTWKEGDNKLTFGRKISKHSLYFFLFTDLLVVTKKKSEDQHMVLDYCPRNMVQVLELESADKFPGRLLDGHKNLIIMTMLQNHETKTVEMVLSCPLESDRTRWMEGVTPRISENPDERIYEEWDCPQVQAVHTYVSTQPDELTLEISDVFNVLKKTSDGWYQGERLRDGSRGWFPGNHTVEIASAHVRARNLRQRYRLLAISGSIVDELKKEKEKFEKEEKKKERRRTITIKEVL